MTDLPQRPKFYLHRSRRFWSGFGLLLILTTCWLSFQSSATGLSYRHAVIATRDGVHYFYPHDLPGGTTLDWDRYMEIIQHKGRIWVVWNTPQTDGRWTPGEWHGFHYEQADFDEGSFGDLGTGRTVPNHFSIPLWPLPLIWAILWPLCMRRWDKLEEKRFLNAPQALDP